MLQGLPPARGFVARRDRDRDLEFTGWRLGAGEVEVHPDTPLEPDQPPSWGAKVDIYLTVGGKYVAAIKRWRMTYERSGVGREAVTENRWSAAALSTPQDLVEWLRRDGRRGRLGRASKQALQQAANAWPPLADAAVERIL
jgi:hypothetical protein